MGIDEIGLRRFGIKEYEIVDELPDDAEDRLVCALKDGTKYKFFTRIRGAWEEIKFIEEPKKLELPGCWPVCGTLMSGFQCEWCGEMFI